jgi:glycosyltransferase involved in cell wall biosynthesis
MTTEHWNTALSVIVPTYNRAAAVRANIHSILACGVQDVEMFVVDDGSTDETESVVRAFGPPVHYLKQANAGPVSARARGVEASHGRYLAFVDDDDEWLPGVAPTIVRILDEYPEIDLLFADALMGNREKGFESWINVAGQAAFFQLPARGPMTGLRIFDPIPFFRRMAERNPVFIGATVLRRSAYKRSGGFDPQLRGAADWELWLRIASRMTCAFWHEPLAIYTRHDQNMSSDHDTMGEEFCLTLGKVLDKCHWLAPAERAWIRSRHRSHLFGHAYRAYSRGDYPLARRRFADLLRKSGLEARAALYWFVSALPFGLPGYVRSLRQSVVRP